MCNIVFVPLRRPLDDVTAPTWHFKTALKDTPVQRLLLYPPSQSLLQFVASSEGLLLSLHRVRLRRNLGAGAKPSMQRRSHIHVVTTLDRSQFGFRERELWLCATGSPCYT